ncbi:MAG: SpoIIIAH-like family protein [Clostridia bacterium]|nr:SpoIIIAH-like family protein [Clostridia bacterium]MBQ4322920.1 SpoIIIAH-like family protein [Clostridia bacterium]
MKKKKYITIAVMSLLLLVVVAVNWKFSLFNNLFSSEDPAPQPSSPVGGSTVESNYFEEARYTRDKSREEAIALLNSVASDEAVEEGIRENAYKEIVAYAKITEGEASLESVLKAKGFSDCIVYLTSDTATVVVAAESLNDQQSAQIFDAVLSHTGFVSGAVKIVSYP